MTIIYAEMVNNTLYAAAHQLKERDLIRLPRDITLRRVPRQHRGQHQQEKQHAADDGSENRSE